MGKPLPVTVQAGLMRGGVAILMGLTLFLITADLLQIVG